MLLRDKNHQRRFTQNKSNKQIILNEKKQRSIHTSLSPACFSNKKLVKSYQFFHQKQTKHKLSSLHQSPKNYSYKHQTFLLTSKNFSYFNNNNRTNKNKNNKKRVNTCFSFKSNNYKLLSNKSFDQQVSKSLEPQKSSRSLNKISKQFKNVGIIKRIQLIDQQFDFQCEQAQRYSRLKNSFNNRNQIKFLRPHLNIKSKKPISELKSQLYEQINHNTSTLQQKDDQNSQKINFIQYTLEYDNDNNKYVQSIKNNAHKKKVGYCNVLREKLRKYYTESQYSHQMNIISEKYKFQKNNSFNNAKK